MKSLKFHVSLDGTLLSHAMNLNVSVLTPTLRICRVRALKERNDTHPVD